MKNTVQSDRLQQAQQSVQHMQRVEKEHDLVWGNKVC